MKLADCYDITMRGLIGSIVLALLVWVLAFWKRGSDDGDRSPAMEVSERVTKSPRERQLQEVRAKSARVLHAGNAQEKIEEFLKAHAGMSGWDQRTVREFNQLAYHWGVADPEGAMAYVGRLNGPADSILRQRLTAQILRAWGLVDHKAALAWFETPGQEREKNSQTLVNVIQGMFYADPKAVDDFLLGLPETEAPVNRTYIDRVARMHFLHHGLEEATKWVRGFPNERIRMRAFHKIAEDLAARDPGEAAEWITRYAGEAAAKLALGSIASDLSRSGGVSPGEVAKWARSLPAGEGRGKAIAVAVAEWARQEPVEAAGFMKRLPKGKEREEVVAGFAPAVARENPEIAIEWAQTISDPAGQDDTMIRTLLQWAIADREAAASWMETAEVTEEVREAISKSPFFGNRRDE